MVFNINMLEQPSDSYLNILIPTITTIAVFLVGWGFKILWEKYKKRRNIKEFKKGIHKELLNLIIQYHYNISRIELEQASLVKLKNPPNYILDITTSDYYDNTFTTVHLSYNEDERFCINYIYAVMNNLKQMLNKYPENMNTNPHLVVSWLESLIETYETQILLINSFIEEGESICKQRMLGRRLIERINKGISEETIRKRNQILKDKLKTESD